MASHEGLLFRIAREADIPAIKALAEKTWWAHYPAIIGQDATEYMLQKMYHTGALLSQMQGGHRFMLAEDEGALVGFLSYEDKGEVAAPKRGASMQKTPPVMVPLLFVHKFYVDSDKHRSGIGSALLQALVSEGDKSGMQSRLYRLHVNRDNHKPIAFYKRHGFVCVGENDTPLGEGYFMYDFVFERLVSSSNS